MLVLRNLSDMFHVKDLHFLHSLRGFPIQYLQLRKNIDIFQLL